MTLTGMAEECDFEDRQALRHSFTGMAEECDFEDRQALRRS